MSFGPWSTRKSSCLTIDPSGPPRGAAVAAMIRHLGHGGWWQWAVAWACIAPAVQAQLPQPKLDWVFPPGGQRGAKVEVTVGGADLDEGQEIIFSHPGIVGRQRRSAADEFYADGQPIVNAFTVEIAADVPPGLYDAQVAGRHGVSTTRIFQVSGVEEVVENGSNHVFEQAQPLKVASVASGRTDAELDDVYSIELKEGDDLTCEALAQRIDSQAQIWLEVGRPDGAPLIVPQRLVGRDPLVHFKAPTAGKYRLRVHDALYRGGEAFFYRLGIRQQGAAHYAMPPAVVPGAEAEIALFDASAGAKLTATPLRTVRVTAPAGAVAGAGVSYSLTALPREADVERFTYLPADAPAGSDPIWIGIAGAQVQAEQEPNNAAAKAQRIGPGEVAGRFFPSGDADWFEFQPDAAGEWVFEVFSQRLGLATDAQLILSRVKKDHAGSETLEQVAEADNGDARPALPGCSTMTDDPYLRVALEKDVVYRMLVRDQNSLSRAEAGNVYRLAVRRPRPDFHLLAAPLSPWNTGPEIPLRWPFVVRAGGALVVPVVAIRQDRFAGDIVVSAEGLPAGLSCEPVTIRNDKSEANLVVLADAGAKPWVGAIHVTGTSKNGETQLQREAVPTSLVTDTATAKFERSRLNHRLVLAVAPEVAPVSLRWSKSSLEAPQGDVVKGKLAIAIRAELKGLLAAVPIGLPEGVTAKFVVSDDKQSAELELTVGNKVAVGVYDFLLAAKPKVLYRNNPEAAARASDDQARIAMLVAGFKAGREKLVAATGSGAAAESPEVKQLVDQIVRGEAALKEATERAAKLAAAAPPTERQCDVFTSMATLHVIEKAKQ